ncbi:MAG: complex I subunit 1 family protein [Myxococcota bacterium]
MPEVASLHPVLAAAVAPAWLLLGAWVVAAVDGVTGRLVAGHPVRGVLVEPLRVAARVMAQRAVPTERPDAMSWLLAPACYAALSAAGLSVVPLGEGVAIADVRTGIVFFGAAEALALVAVFLHGWAPNSHLSLLGGYRFVALGLSYELLSMFVLIAAALPAESLQVSAIVRSQSELWNVVRQPLGLPLWIVVTLGVTFWGPLDLADGRDAAGGTSVEASGRQRLVWELARRGMLVVFAAMGAAVFLGGWLGPVLPGWAWMAIKTLGLVVLTTWVGHRVGRVPSDRIVPILWTVLLPLAFLGLAQAGWQALP